MERPAAERLPRGRCAGDAGVHKESIEAFESKLSDDLYKLWNRLCSGSYFPPPVKAVPIPKKSGGTRLLGVPTVADRIAQTVVKQILEPIESLSDQIAQADREVKLDAHTACAGGGAPYTPQPSRRIRTPTPRGRHKSLVTCASGGRQRDAGSSSEVPSTPGAEVLRTRASQQ
jgi:hypothetical protein